MRILISICIAAGLASAETATGVDIAWKVLPRRVTSDNFGSRVAKLYFAVTAVVGNHTGYDLQVSSVLFQLPSSTGISTPIPADPYRVVRGTLERERQVGLRNTGVNAIKALGPVLAGVTAFYSGSAYGRIISLFSNPFEKGVEFVFPDKTINQMLSLDNQALREGTIIAKDTQQGMLVFISRDVLLTPENRKRMTSRFKSEFEPMAVMQALGELVLVGKSVQYVERITVKAAAE